MPPHAQSPWPRRLRRLFFLFGTASTIYLLSTFALDRMREARVRALKERRERDLIKSHFSSLLSTISFTLYALLPTLAPQLIAAYPVEETSQALQGISGPSSQASVRETPERTPATSLLLQDNAGGGRDGSEMGWSEGLGSPRAAEAGGANDTAEKVAIVVGESWSSEFQRQNQGQPAESENFSLSGTEGSESFSVDQPETDDGISSTVSQTISLPPTDVSSVSGSPPSDLSQSAQLHPSPPRVPYAASTATLQVPNLETRSKKELWRELKVQSLTRALSTAYLLPLLHLLTASQLATLARLRYLHDIKASLPPTPRQTLPLQSSSSSDQRTGWFSSFSIDSMGLSEFVDETTSLLPNPGSFLPTAVTRHLPSWLAPSPSGSMERTDVVADAAAVEAEEEERRAEDERNYLTYSWWLLHEGWKGVGQRVEDEVERVFGTMPLKRELSVDEWDGLIREVRAGVETVEGSELHDFTSNVIPPTPLPPMLDTSCPLPSATCSPHLISLLQQTRTHLQSPDGRYLITKGVDAMVRQLLASVREESRNGLEGSNGAVEGKRRLVDCLPGINRWGKGIWEGLPDGGVEELLALPEYENFAALVFGDWAPQ